MVDNCIRKDYYLETDSTGSKDKCTESPLPVARVVMRNCIKKEIAATYKI